MELRLIKENATFTEALQAYLQGKVVQSINIDSVNVAGKAGVRCFKKKGNELLQYSNKQWLVVSHSTGFNFTDYGTYHICQEIKDRPMTIEELREEAGASNKLFALTPNGNKRIAIIHNDEVVAFEHCGMTTFKGSAEEFCEKFTRSDYSKFIVGDE